MAEPWVGDPGLTEEDMARRVFPSVDVIGADVTGLTMDRVKPPFGSIRGDGDQDPDDL